MAGTELKATIEQCMDYTQKAATRAAGDDANKLNLAFRAVRVPVSFVKFNLGIMYQYYFRLNNPADIAKIAQKKTQDTFAYIFGSTKTRVYAEDGCVVVEVPGADSGVVRAADILRSDAYLNADGLAVAIGKRMDYTDVVANIEDMPHMLVAGQTGSGKSVFMHQVILSLLLNHEADELELYMVDPKQTEFMYYKPLKNCHVVTETSEAVGLLNSLCEEMDARYGRLSASGCRDIASYNMRAARPMSRKVVFVDELADLMMSARAQAEKYVVRLAQKARACGIHLVIATQRPDRNVVTGLIKANIPVKVCLRVTSQVNSMVVLDMVGAERLSGHGDMLYLGDGMLQPVRCQSGLVQDYEIRNIVNTMMNRRAVAA